MPGFSWQEIFHAFLLLWDRRPPGLTVYAAGGAVPWLLSGRDSGRLHGDLDMVTGLDSMLPLRRFLQEQGWYRPEGDSLLLPCNVRQEDHGVEAVISGVPVNFAPFVQRGPDLIQRNFSLSSLAGFDALVTATMRNMSGSDYAVLSPAPNIGTIGILSPEVVRAAKERSAQDRDRRDLEALSRLPFDAQRYRRVRKAVAEMQIDVQG